MNGQVVRSNVPVTDKSSIKIQGYKGVISQNKQRTRVWLFHKPKNMLTSHYDPQGRETVFGYLKEKGFNQHLISVGRLDYMSEGLLIITNDGLLARVLELPSRLMRARPFTLALVYSCPRVLACF